MVQNQSKKFTYNNESMRKPNKKRNPFAKQLRHFTSKMFKVKNKYDRKKLEKHSSGD
jgi:hypothetical protein